MIRGVSGRRRQWEGVFFILPSLAGVTAFILVPFLDVVRRSFTEVMSGKFAGLKNYRTIFSNSAFCRRREIPFASPWCAFRSCCLSHWLRR